MFSVHLVLLVHLLSLFSLSSAASAANNETNRGSVNASSPAPEDVVIYDVPNSDTRVQITIGSDLLSDETYTVFLKQTNKTINDAIARSKLGRNSFLATTNQDPFVAWDAFFHVQFAIQSLESRPPAELRPHLTWGHAADVLTALEDIMVQDGRFRSAPIIKIMRRTTKWVALPLGGGWLDFVPPGALSEKDNSTAEIESGAVNATDITV